MANKIKVLVIDDSAFIRSLLSNILNNDPMIEVVDTACDPIEAKEKIKTLNPDVLTLDIQMPNMNGLEFLERLMAHRPMPVVMISSLTELGAAETIKALELGAVDFVTKPKRDIERSIKELSLAICEKIKIAAQAQIIHKKTIKLSQAKNVHGNLEDVKILDHYIVIGSSTGGVEALSEIITNLPAVCAPILITQHMPEKFTTSFAARLNKTSALTVHEAQDGQPILPNNVYLAPGGYHMGIRKLASSFAIQLNDGPLINGHKPSVDFLFESVAQYIPCPKVCGIILTGMGKDGAVGLKKLKEKGALTYGQNEASCVVYGMPRAAQEIDAVKKELNLNEIATHIMRFCT